MPTSGHGSSDRERSGAVRPRTAPAFARWAMLVAGALELSPGADAPAPEPEDEHPAPAGEDDRLTVVVLAAARGLRPAPARPSGAHPRRPYDDGPAVGSEGVQLDRRG